MEANREDVTAFVKDRAFTFGLFLFGVIFGGLAALLFSWFFIGSTMLLCFITVGGMLVGGIIGGPVAALLQLLTGSFERQAPEQTSDKYFEL